MANASAVLGKGLIPGFGWVAYGTWTEGASGTSINIATGLNAILYSEITNNTTDDHGVLDDQTTAGTIALTGITTSDSGRWLAIGK